MPCDFRYLCWIVIIAILNFLPVSMEAKTNKASEKQKKDAQYASAPQYFKHDIQLQLTDSFGFPFDTKFWVTLDIIKEDSKITILIPSINFQTLSTAAPGNPIGSLFVPGGYLYTSKGFLPEFLRPTDLVNRAVIAASNNGSCEAFTHYPPTFPTPPVGYILQVTSSGAIVIQCAGTFGNIIPPGNQILMPTSITYLHTPKKTLCKNITISRGATNTTGFTDPSAANDGLRDSHPNDAYKGTAAWVWTDNSNIDQTNNTLNVMVAIGSTDASGKLTVRKPIQLTNFPPGVMAWDTSVAINRSNPQNIVVSYGLLDNVNFYFLPCRAVSFDGGKTWPAQYEYTAMLGSISGTTLTVTNVFFGSLETGQTVFARFIPLPGTPVAPNTVITGQLSGTPGGVGTYSLSGAPQTIASVKMVAAPPLNGAVDILPQYADGFGDNRGVLSDKFGNIWYATTTALDTSTNFFNAPFFAYSSDGGVTYTQYPQALLNIPPIPNPATQFYDYTQVCFGVDESLNYGMYFVYGFFDSNSPDVFQTLSFFPITNPIVPQPAVVAPLPQFTNAITGSTLATASDGRVWLQGVPNPFLSDSFIQPTSWLFKSPGPIGENYAGPWNHDIFRNFIPYTGRGYPGSGYDSQPVVGVLLHAVNSIVYDDKRQALYALLAFQTPDYSQNMRLCFLISRNNGETWSNPIDVATTSVANRGLATMALDSKTGNLIFGWYDGRKDPKFKALEYFAAAIPAKKLDCLVNQIPLSDPLYSIAPPQQMPLSVKAEVIKECRNKKFERRHLND